MVEADSVVGYIASLASPVDSSPKIISGSAMPGYSTPTQDSAHSILEMLVQSYADGASGDPLDPSYSLLGILTQLPNEIRTLLPDLPSWVPDWAKQWPDLSSCSPTPSPPPPPYSLVSVRTCEQFLRSFSPATEAPTALTVADSWTSHVLEISIKTDENRSDSAAGYHRNEARRTFMRMLDDANPHILSSLIHVACIFWGHGSCDIYRTILADCWELINRNLIRNKYYAIPLGYALACEMGEQDGVSKLGSLLLDGAEQTDYGSRSLSSNFLVYQQFRAHYLLENMQDAEEARDLLIQCLHKSSQCLKRGHSFNLSGLNILARAYERLGQYQTAIQCYSDAAQRSQTIFGSKHPYRMMILRNIALLQEKLRMYAEAERNLREVFWNRAELLGPLYELTFSSRQDLQQFLLSHSRREEAVQLYETLEAFTHNEKHWKILSETDAVLIRRQRPNTCTHWEHPKGLFKYSFVMPREAYVRLGVHLNLYVS